MPLITTSIPHNKYLAFIQLSGPKELHDDIWADKGERVLILGVRKTSNQSEIEGVAASVAKASFKPVALQGTNVSAKIRIIVEDNPEKIKELLGRLEDKHILSIEEHTRLLLDMGLGHVRTPRAKDALIGVGGDSI